jgi:fatty-acyl-CoA synthase
MLDQLDRRDRLRLVEFVCSFAWADLEIKPEERVFIARLIRSLDLELQIARFAIMRNDGFMDTGDMGYWADGEIVIPGRAKDMILYNGRNIWPQDIEWAVERLDQVRDGDVAAFAMEGANGEDRVTVLVQCRLRDPEAIEELRKQVSAQIVRSIGIEADVVMVPPKCLPFTSSGKLSRAGAKALYVSGDIAEIAGEPGNEAGPVAIAAE